MSYEQSGKYDVPRKKSDIFSLCGPRPRTLTFGQDYHLGDDSRVVLHPGTKFSKAATVLPPERPAFVRRGDLRIRQGRGKRSNRVTSSRTN